MEAIAWSEIPGLGYRAFGIVDVHRRGVHRSDAVFGVVSVVVYVVVEQVARGIGSAIHAVALTPFVHD